MAVAVKVGAIIRRGAGMINAETMKLLIQHEGRVQEIVAEIDARTAVFREQAEAASKKLAALEVQEKDVIAREVELTESKARLAAEEQAWEEQHTSDMEALSRRSREIVVKAGVADERERLLDDHDKKVADSKAEIERFTTRLNEAVAEGRLATNESEEEHDHGSRSRRS